jgi:hypothetical protein
MEGDSRVALCRCHQKRCCKLLHKMGHNSPVMRCQKMLHRMGKTSPA